MKKQKRVIITGKDGFLGRNMLSYLTNEENNVYYFIGRHQYDLAKTYEVVRLFRDFKPTHIVHLAGMASARNTDTSFIDSNIKATYNLLELCPNEIDFIFTSSVLVYGNSDGCMHESDKLKPGSHYAISKVCCENMIDLYVKKGKIRGRILRVCGVVGPYMKHGRIHSILEGERDLAMFGNAPGNSCPLITSENAMKSLVKAIEYNKPNLVCNVSPNQNTISIGRIFEVMEEELGIKLNVSWRPDNQPPEYICCDNSRLEYELGVNIHETSEEALRKGLKLYNDECKTRETAQV